MEYIGLLKGKAKYFKPGVYNVMNYFEYYIYCIVLIIR